MTQQAAAKGKHWHERLELLVLFNELCQVLTTAKERETRETQFILINNRSNQIGEMLLFSSYPVNPHWSYSKRLPSHNIRGVSDNLGRSSSDGWEAAIVIQTRHSEPAEEWVGWKEGNLALCSHGRSPGNAAGRGERAGCHLTRKNERSATSKNWEIAKKSPQVLEICRKRPQNYL